MRELSLFAGSGGGILGGYLLGWTTICAVEIEDYPRRVLLQRQRDGILPRFPIWDDIRTFDGRPWSGRCDIVSGGFPCTDISVAGKGAGIDGEQSGLWQEMARIIGEVRPRFAFVENVPALTCRGLGRVLGDLAALGYNARWCVLGADDAGAPHRRKRIWILAYTDRPGIREQSEFKPGRPEAAEPKYAGKVLADTACARNGELPIRPGESRQTEADIDGSGEDVPNAQSEQVGPTGQPRKHKRMASDANGKGLQESTQGSIGSIREKKRKSKGSKPCRGDAKARTYWSTEPAICRVVNGFPARVDRLKALGNAQVPEQMALAFIILSEGLWLK